MAQTMIFDITEQNLQDMVLHNSQHLPVLIAFWQPNCKASQQIMPALEQLAETFSGRFILAKLNIATEKILSEKFQISQTPVFKIVIQGQVAKALDQNTSIEQIQTELEAFMAPDPSETLRAEANQAFNAGQIDQALSLLAQAAQADNTNFKVHLDLAKMYYQTGHIEKAQNLIEKLPDEAKQSKEGKRLQSLFTYTKIIAEIGDIETIQATLNDTPNHPDALYGLFAFLMLNNQLEQAIQTLFKLFETNPDYENNTPKKALLKLFDQLNDEHPKLVTHYRRKLQSLLF